MVNGIENIGKRDVAWSYAATILKVGAGVILLPFILNKLPSETVGLWNIFLVFHALVLLLDFGFCNSFIRNVSYIFSGVKHLKKNNVETVQEDGNEVDYAMLKGLLKAMKRFYGLMTLVVFVLLATAGTAYMWYILGKYTGDRREAMIAWSILVTNECYYLYTFYYNALLSGKGYVKRERQITILGQMLYLGVAIGLIFCGCGLSAIVGAQLVSTIVRRILTYRVFFTREMKTALAQAEEHCSGDIMKVIVPNAVKKGLTELGRFCVSQSTILMGSAFLSLEQVACYGITIHVMGILENCGLVFYKSYIPKLAQCYTTGNKKQLSGYYRQSITSMVAIYALAAPCWLTLGDWALNVVHSQTSFVPATMLCVMLALSLLQTNQTIAIGFIEVNNRIPFFIPSLVSGAATIALMYVFLSPLDFGIWGLTLAPGIVNLAYQNWKWPCVIIKELRGHANK